MAKSWLSTPPMGWNSWNAFSVGVNEGDIQKAADAMVERGLLEAGYNYLVVDDTWMAESLDEKGNFKPHPDDFSGGISDLADYVHERGLNFGIYSSAGTETCAGFPGSLGHEARHAKQFSDWGVDYLKYDNCGDHLDRDAIDRYFTMGRALASVDREIVYSICEWGDNKPWLWGRNVGGQLWRVTGDILAKWEATEEDEFGLGVIDIIDRVRELDISSYHGPGGWNDPDMLQVGNGPDSGQSQIEGISVDRPFPLNEQRVHFSFWCLFSAPLMAGNDLFDMDDSTEKILLNEDAIAIDQDPLGIQGTCDWRDGDREVWSKRLAGGDCAIILFNRGEEELRIEADFDDVDVYEKSDMYHVREIWGGEEWDDPDGVRGEVGPRDVLMFRVSPE